jgi:hypothetical protein
VNSITTVRTLAEENAANDETLARSADGSWIFNLPVQTLDVGFSNVNVFVGNANGSALQTAADTSFDADSDFDLEAECGPGHVPG